MKPETKATKAARKILAAHAAAAAGALIDCHVEYAENAMRNRMGVKSRVKCDRTDLVHTFVHLRHWCDVHGIDFHIALNDSYLKYLEDKADK